MNPEILVRKPLRQGRRVPLIPHQPLDVPLFWQRGRIASGHLGDMTRAVLRIAGGALQRS